jgi:hypothetical protein
MVEPTSILKDVRHAVVSFDDDDSFDRDLILYINGALMVLNQIGVGPEKPFRITGEDETWADFLGEQEELLPLVQPYVIHKVTYNFDTPTSTTRNEALINLIAEDEWRLNVAVDPTAEEIEDLRAEMAERQRV